MKKRSSSLKEAKFLATTIGFLQPIAITPAFVDAIPKWVSIICLMIHSGCTYRLNFIIDPKSLDHDKDAPKDTQNDNNGNPTP